MSKKASTGDQFQREVFRVRADGSYVWPDLEEKKVAIGIHMPPAALEAGARALHAKGDWSHIPWEELEDCDRDYYKAEARATFVAIVSAWEGMRVSRVLPPNELHVVLPLMETRDDE